MDSEPFVGRTEEQDRFRLSLADVLAKDHQHDEGFVVLVHGHGGHGKTTLLDRYAEIAKGDLPADAANRRKFLVVKVNWEDDRNKREHRADYATFDGPEIWKILARIRSAALDHASAGKDRRRIEKLFEPFVESTLRLSAVRERAAHRGLAELIGGRRRSAEDLVQLGFDVVATTADVANELGAPIPASSGKAASRLGGVARDVISSGRGRRGRISKEEYDSLIDEVDAVVRAFADALHEISTKLTPLVLLLDTCELLGGAGNRLREIMRRSGRRIVWVVGIRLEDEADAEALTSESALYRAEIRDTRLRSIPVRPFDKASVAEYLRARCGHERIDDRMAEQVAEITKRIPLAVRLVANLVLTGQDSALAAVDEVIAEFTGGTEPSGVVQSLARRYLMHAKEVEEQKPDLEKLYSLALLYINDTSTDANVAVLSSQWEIPAKDVEAVLAGLARRYDFVPSGKHQFHQDIRETIRTYLRDPLMRPAVREMNESAARTLATRLARYGNTLDGQLGAEAWCADVTLLVWHTFWADLDDGVQLLCQLYPAIRLLDRSTALDMLKPAQFFMPVLSGSQRGLVNTFQRLAEWYGPSPTRDELRGVVRGCTDARPSHEVLASDVPRTALIDLMMVDLGENLHNTHRRLALLEQIADQLRSVDGVLGEAIAKCADGLSKELTDVERLQQDRSGAAARAATLMLRYAPERHDVWGRFGLAQLAIGDRAAADEAFAKANQYTEDTDSYFLPGLADEIFALGWPEVSVTVYRFAIDHAPNNARLRNSLGNVLSGLGAYRDAEVAYRRAVELDGADGWYHYHLAVALLALDRHEEADVAGQAALAAFKTAAKGKSYRSSKGPAYVCHRLGRFADAVTAYRNAIDQAPNDADLHTGLGNALFDMGAYRDAEVAYRRAVELDSANGSHHHDLAVALLELGRYEEAQGAGRAAVEAFTVAIKRRPRVADLHRGLGGALAWLRRPGDAVKCFRQALDLVPDTADVHHGLGSALFDLGAYLGAEVAYRRAVELDNANGWYHHSLAGALLTLGRYEEAQSASRAAVEAFTAAIKHRPGVADLHRSLGWALARLGRPGDAVKCFRQALDLAPDIVGVHNDLGNALYEQGEYQAAAESLSRAVELDSADGWHHYNLANTLLGLGQDEEAQSACQAALAAFRVASKRTSGSAGLHRGLGHAYFWLGRYGDAVTEYRLAVELTPLSADLHDELGNALFEQGAYREAEVAYRRAVELNSADGGHHHSLAGVLRALGRHGEAQVAGKAAVEAFIAAIDRVAGDVRSRRGVGLAYYRLARYGDAAAAYRQAVKLNPNDADLHNDLGNALFCHGGYREAEQAFRRAVDLVPTNGWYRHNLADALFALDERAAAVAAAESAVEAFTAATARMPDWIGHHRGLGETYRQLGRYADATGHYRRALELCPGDGFLQAELGTALLEAGRYDEAEEALRAALRSGPGTCLTAAVRLALIVRGREPEPARELFAKGLEDPVRSTSLDTRVQLRAIALAGLDRVDEALAEIATLVGTPCHDVYVRQVWRLLEEPPLPGVERLRAALEAAGRIVKGG